MADVWDEARVQQYIDDGIEESLNLDYKAAGALAKTDGKRKEITKDVSAMANSDGGVIIYGLIETNHFPGSIDPVKRCDFSKEWLEHVIGNIRPKIDGLLIHPVPIGNSTTDVVYVVEIPKSHTAHQAMDKRYYKRFNFESVPMEHYEILDVLNRQKHPRIELNFKILVKKIEETASGLPDEVDYGMPVSTKTANRNARLEYELAPIMVNSGAVMARYVEARITIPYDLIYDFNFLNGTDPSRRFDLNDVSTFSRWNTERDIVGFSGPSFHSNPNYGPARHVPVFPGLDFSVGQIRLCETFSPVDWNDVRIEWTTYADKAQPHSGETTIGELELEDDKGNVVLVHSIV